MYKQLKLYVSTINSHKLSCHKRKLSKFPLITFFFFKKREKEVAAVKKGRLMIENGSACAFQLLKKKTEGKKKKEGKRDRKGYSASKKDFPQKMNNNTPSRFRSCCMFYLCDLNLHAKSETHE